MKDFLIQCLKDLEELTGLRQLYFLQSDLEDGERRKNVLIAGMVAACDKFDYITDEDKKKIITRMMVEDQSYEALNSRVIFRWLDLHKSTYFRGQSHVGFEPDAAMSYAQYVEMCKANNTEPVSENDFDKPASEEMVKKYTDLLRSKFQQNGDAKTSPQPVAERYGRSALPGYYASKQKFVIEGIEIYADSEEQAKQMYHQTLQP